MYAAQVLIFFCKIGAYSPSWIWEMPFAPVRDACSKNVMRQCPPPLRARFTGKPCCVLQSGTLVSTWLGSHRSAVIYMRQLTLLMVSRSVHSAAPHPALQLVCIAATWDATAR